MASSGSGMLYESGVLYVATTWTTAPTPGVFTVPNGRVFVGQITAFNANVDVWISVGNPFLVQRSFTIYADPTTLDTGGTANGRSAPHSYPIVLGGDMTLGIDASAWSNAVLSGVLYVNP